MTPTTVTYANIETRLGETFAATDEGNKRPTQANVTAFIVDARLIFKAYTNITPDETVTEHAEIIIEIVCRMVQNWYWHRSRYKVSYGGGPESVSRSPVEVITPALMVRLNRIKIFGA